MFYSLTGDIVCRDESSVALDCGGVAFKCAVTYNTLKQIGEKSGKVTLFTHLNVRDDALNLYGFFDIRELDAFKLLIGVSGVGPKAALSILSELTVDALALAVASDDIKSVTRAQGVGPKLAQRVVLELKDKFATYPEGSERNSLSAVSSAAQMSNTQSAIAALTELGYSQSEAALAVSKLDPDLDISRLVTLALKGLASFR